MSVISTHWFTVLNSTTWMPRERLHSFSCWTAVCMLDGQDCISGSFSNNSQRENFNIYFKNKKTMESPWGLPFSHWMAGCPAAYSNYMLSVLVSECHTSATQKTAPNSVSYKCKCYSHVCSSVEVVLLWRVSFWTQAGVGRGGGNGCPGHVFTRHHWEMGGASPLCKYMWASDLAKPVTWPSASQRGTRALPISGRRGEWVFAKEESKRSQFPIVALFPLCSWRITQNIKKAFLKSQPLKYKVLTLSHS